jgi:hypothetical protein
MTESQEVPHTKEKSEILDYIAYNKIGEKNYEFNKIWDKGKNSISLPEIEGKTILEIETEVGPAFYVKPEGTLTIKIINNAFKNEGFPTENSPFFVRRILPEEKAKLESEGYQITTADRVVASPV